MKSNDYVISVLNDRIEKLEGEISRLEESLTSINTLATKVLNCRIDYFSSSEICCLNYLLYDRARSIEEDLAVLKSCIDDLEYFIGGLNNEQE